MMIKFIQIDLKSSESRKWLTRKATEGVRRTECGEGCVITLSLLQLA